MSGFSIFGAVQQLALKQPDRTALVGKSQKLSYAELVQAIQNTGEQLRVLNIRMMALALDNSPVWAVLDLAAMESNIPVVPLPFFFSAGQVLHALRDAGANCLVTDQPEYYARILADAGIAIHTDVPLEIQGQAVGVIHLLDMPVQTLPSGTVKVTYTSGTTGQPKGVCLSNEALIQVSASLIVMASGQEDDKHVSLLPLSTLLENIGGIYVPLLAGACCTLLPLAEVGMSGASGLDVGRMCAAVAMHQATSTILTPEMLQGLLAALEAGGAYPQHLRFLAVGGASVAPRLLHRAQRMGLPVFEGYGLSECCSVVALNTPDAHLIGSVGKPLPHVRLKFADDGEILVSGATLLGYAGGEPADIPAGYWPTGDIGHLDEQGFLHITGRKKNMFITSFGRNVAPEWVERELTQHPAIAQAAMFGEARPWNVAVIVARGDVEAVNRAIVETNRLLPDYAQVHRWIAAQAPFTPHNGQLTPNGRLRRENIRKIYQTTLNALYEEPNETVL